MFGSTVQTKCHLNLQKMYYLPSLRKVLPTKHFYRNFGNMTLEVNAFPAKAILSSGSSKNFVDHEVTNILSF